MKKTTFFVLAAAIPLSAMLSGCGGSPDENPDAGQASGTLKSKDGQAEIVAPDVSAIEDPSMPAKKK